MLDYRGNGGSILKGQILYNCILRSQVLTGYLRYKTTFCLKETLDVQTMIFFIWRKNVSFLRYIDFCVYVKFTDFKICDVIISSAT